METVECYNLQNEVVHIPKAKIVFRPSAYGIIIDNGTLLLTNTKSTGKYSLPGGGVNPGETLEQGLKREISEECGIDIEIKKPLFFKERYFYYDPSDRAWQILAFFYLAVPLSTELTDQGNEPDDEADKPQWVDIATLKEPDFQVFGAETLNFLKSLN